MPNQNPRRCVFGCYTKGVTVHDFPHPVKFPELFQAWIDIVGESLKNLTSDEIYRKKKVCHIHFTEKDWNRNNRLNALAVPSLHLPGATVLHAHRDHDYCKSEPMPLVPMASTSSTMDIPLQDITNLQSKSCSTDDAISVLHAPGDENRKCTTSVAVPIPMVNPQTIQITPTSSHDVKSMPSTSYSRDTGLPLQISAQETDVVQSNQTSGHNQAAGHLASIQRASNTCSKESRKSPTLKIHHYQYTQRSIRNLKREIIRLRKKSKCFKRRLANAEKLNNDVSFQKVTRSMTVAAKLFTEMQFRQTKKQPKGRRFSIEQKILSLSLYKRSPKGYGLLSKCFTLPSPRTLKSLLSQIKIEPGINKLIFEKMKTVASEMTSEDKLCTLIFDEMYITPQLKYDITKDHIKGFVTNGTRKIADHVLVFMVKGIKRSYKQPVAYYFTENLNKNELKTVLKDVVNQVTKTGFNILCTICDQSTINTGAINSLIEDTKRDYLKNGKEWRHDIFEVGKKQIIPLYDVPHLLKGVRNNILTKDLKYVDSNDQNKEKIIKWSYFQQLYEADKSYEELRCVQKLTEEHVDPSKINKMRVKLAAQVFSHSVAVAAEHLTARGDLPAECRNIIPFVLLMDKLFDSLKGITDGEYNIYFHLKIRIRSPYNQMDHHTRRI